MVRRGSDQDFDSLKPEVLAVRPDKIKGLPAEGNPVGHSAKGRGDNPPEVGKRLVCGLVRRGFPEDMLDETVKAREAEKACAR
jgi:hypothetical protein